MSNNGIHKIACIKELTTRIFLLSFNNSTIFAVKSCMKAPISCGTYVKAAIRFTEAFNATAKGVKNEAVRPSITAKAAPSYIEYFKLFFTTSSAMEITLKSSELVLCMYNHHFFFKYHFLANVSPHSGQ